MMLKLSVIHPLIIQSIKIISPIIIIGSISLELIYFSDPLIVQKIIFGQFLIIFATIPIIGHLIEAIIVSFLAIKQQENPFQWAIYTFFIGTIALLELKELTLNTTANIRRNDISLNEEK